MLDGSKFKSPIQTVRSNEGSLSISPIIKGKNIGARMVELGYCDKSGVALENVEVEGPVDYSFHEQINWKALT